MQHGAAIAKPRDAGSVQQMGINARGLRGGVRTQTQHAATELVHQLEGPQVEFVPSAREQRLQMLKQGRNHQFKATPGGLVDQAPAQGLDLKRLSWQNVCDMFRQQPGSGHVSNDGEKLRL
jgi:hypothetical protein